MADPTHSPGASEPAQKGALECGAPPTESSDTPALFVGATLIPSAVFQDWVVSAQLAAKLSELDAPQRRAVIDRIGQRSIEQNTRAPGSEESADAGDALADRLSGYLKEVFAFPPIDKERLHCEPCMREDNEKLMHVAIGMISPLTRFQWLGSGFVTAGKFLNEGKDAVVHLVQGNPEWVIKELKFGGAERAEMLALYTNKLAEDSRLMVPELTHLGDGRLLQRFVHGSPIANALYSVEGLAAQKEAVELANLAKQMLGIRGEETFISHPPYKVGIDPSFANFLYREGRLSGWIDPIYSIGTEAVEHGR